MLLKFDESVSKKYCDSAFGECSKLHSNLNREAYYLCEEFTDRSGYPMQLDYAKVRGINQTSTV